MAHSDAATDALIDSLTVSVRPVRRDAVATRLAFAVADGGALVLLFVLIVLGPRPDLMHALHGPSIWMKWAYTLALAAVALPVAQQLARPERRDVRWLWLAAVPVAAVALLAVRELAQAPSRDWAAMWFGHSWRQCSLRVLLLSAPIFAAFLWAFRAFAPTRLRLAGAVAGFAAGASAATLYGIACSETTALFLFTWYTLGIAAATAVGAAVGPRFLRW